MTFRKTPSVFLGILCVMLVASCQSSSHHASIQDQTVIRGIFQRGRATLEPLAVRLIESRSDLRLSRAKAAGDDRRLLFSADSSPVGPIEAAITEEIARLGLVAVTKVQDERVVYFVTEDRRFGSRRYQCGFAYAADEPADLKKTASVEDSASQDLHFEPLSGKWYVFFIEYDDPFFDGVFPSS